MPCAGKASWNAEWIPEWDLANCEEECERIRNKKENKDIVEGVPKPLKRLHHNWVLEFCDNE